MDKSPMREKILAAIINKSTLKQHIFDNTFTTFNELKDVLFEIASELDDDLDGKLDKRVRIEYRDRGKFEAQLQIASDLLIFQMHTDIFEFDSNHIIWQNEYVQAEREAMSERDKPFMKMVMRIDKDTQMGIVTDVKMELRKSMALSVVYSATDRKK